ncbi:outer membrane protein transport protein [Sphingobacterium kyonggiense]|uniref:Outer membrane protein transport protein n=1 Tax=Sphingobacterium kyonggiense TaxID=714075 RepID=A0ABP7Z5D7_9SPHI
MKKSILPLSFLLAFSVQQVAMGQSIYDDAKILSLDELNGTARFRAMGGVNTALGGDISSVSGNPAGLGFFGQSDVSVSLNVLNNNNTTNFFGNNKSTNYAKFGIDNAGIVLYFPTAYDQNYGWQNLNIGVSVNRQNNYSDKVTYSGINNQNTLVQYMTDVMHSASGFAADFKNSYLVEQFANPDDGYFPTVLEAAPKGQQIDLIAGGYKYLTNFSIGANYSHKFYIGGGVGLLAYKNTYESNVYERGWTKRADEIAPDNPNSAFTKPGTIQNKYTDINYSISDRIMSESTGYGANFNFGMIIKPTWDWNIGLTFTSPTWTTIKFDDYLDTEVHYYDNETTTSDLYNPYYSKPDGGSRDYSIISPWKTAFGLTKFFGRGLLSADVEYVGYNSIQYVDESADAMIGSDVEINDDLKATYKGAFNFRVGTEVVVTDRLTARAGYNYRGSAFKDTDKGNSIGTIGLGYIFPNAMYIDVTAMQYQATEYYHQTYSLAPLWKSEAPGTDVKNKRFNAVMTIGLKF